MSRSNRFHAHVICPKCTAEDRVVFEALIGDVQYLDFEVGDLVIATVPPLGRWIGPSESCPWDRAFWAAGAGRCIRCGAIIDARIEVRLRHFHAVHVVEEPLDEDAWGPLPENSFELRVHAAAVGTDCFVCREPVIGLEGQDGFFDPYYLQDSDDAVINASAFGDAHVACVQSSAWMSFWHVRAREAMTRVHHLSPRDDIGGTAIFDRSHAGGLSLVSDAGAIMFVTFSDVDSMSVRNPRRTITHDRLLPALPAIMNVKNGSKLLLADVLDTIGISSRLLRPSAIRTGTVIVQGLDDNRRRARLKYTIELKPDLVERLKKARPPRSA